MEWLMAGLQLAWSPFARGIVFNVERYITTALFQAHG
jgi:hypothetical protein